MNHVDNDNADTKPPYPKSETYMPYSILIFMVSHIMFHIYNMLIAISFWGFNQGTSMNIYIFIYIYVWIEYKILILINHKLFLISVLSGSWIFVSFLVIGNIWQYNCVTHVSQQGLDGGTASFPPKIPFPLDLWGITAQIDYISQALLQFIGTC